MIWLALLWWLSGFIGSGYWWFREFEEIELHDPLIFAFVGAIGPAAFFLGWLFWWDGHHKHDKRDRIVILRKRGPDG